jgi:uncharacterized membrane protein
MRSTPPDLIVADYLRRLDRAVAALPEARRTELSAEIRAHIDDALREAGAADEVTVRNVLDRLGTPEEIAAASGAPTDGGTASSRRRAGALEIAALLVLGLGGVIPIIGWLVGVILVVASNVWVTRDKVIGLLLGLLPVVALLVFLLVAADGNSAPPGAEVSAAEANGGLGPYEILVLVCGLVAGMSSAAYLAWCLRRAPRGVVVDPPDRPSDRGACSASPTGQGQDTRHTATAAGSGYLLARLGVGVWIAHALLSISDASLPAGTLSVLPLLGGLLIVSGVVSSRRAALRAGSAGVSMPALARAFARQLVGLIVVVSGVTLLGAILAGSFAFASAVAYLTIAGAFIAIGAGQARGTVAR